jgi:hypothetical protein
MVLSFPKCGRISLTNIMDPIQNDMPVEPQVADDAAVVADAMADVSAPADMVVDESTPEGEEPAA